MMTNFDGIPFMVHVDPASGVYRDWSGMEPIFIDEQIPYSNLTVSELIGFTPAVVTWRLEMRREDYYALLSRLGTTGTLTVLAGYQSLKGTQITRGNPGVVYEQLDNVRLRAMPSREHHVGGIVEVEATFERAVDPVMRTAVTT